MGNEFGVGCLMKICLEDAWGRLWEGVWLWEGLVGGVSLVEEGGLVEERGSLVWFFE